MFHNIIRFASNKFHFKKTELGVNGVNLIDNRLDVLIFLLSVVGTWPDKTFYYARLEILDQ